MYSNFYFVVGAALAIVDPIRATIKASEKNFFIEWKLEGWKMDWGWLGRGWIKNGQGYSTIISFKFIFFSEPIPATSVLISNPS